MRALISGSRTWDKPVLVDTLVMGLVGAWGDRLVIIQGDNPRGVDGFAKEAARRRGIPHEDFPAEWDVFGKAAGHLRNQEMLDVGKPNVVFCISDDLMLPITDDMRGGTVDMARRSHGAELPTYAIGRVRRG